MKEKGWVFFSSFFAPTGRWTVAGVGWVLRTHAAGFSPCAASIRMAYCVVSASRAGARGGRMSRQRSECVTVTRLGNLPRRISLSALRYWTCRASSDWLR
jgi:hypothetical protein